MSLPLSLASSTRTISSSSVCGERSITEWTVRSSVVHASLWNTITTLVRGRLSGYNLFLHLKRVIKNMEKIIKLHAARIQEYLQAYFYIYKTLVASLVCYPYELKQKEKLRRPRDMLLTNCISQRDATTELVQKPYSRTDMILKPESCTQNIWYQPEPFIYFWNNRYDSKRNSLNFF